MNRKLHSNQTLLEQALTCSGYANEKKQKGQIIKDNKSLATIGDKLLSFLFLEYIEEIGFGKSMEQITNWNEIIQDNDIQNEIGKIIFKDDLTPFAVNDELSGNKAYATCLEAYIYAIYKTHDIESARVFLINEVLLIVKSDSIVKFIRTLLSKKDIKNGKDWNRVLNDFDSFLLLNQ